MNDLETLRERMLALQEVTEETPFGPEVLVYKVAGKMFATLSPEATPVTMNVKCEPEKALELRDRFASILPGYHMNKRHWNTLLLDGTLSDSWVTELILHSYQCVLAGHSKVVRDRLQPKAKRSSLR